MTLSNFHLLPESFQELRAATLPSIRRLQQGVMLPCHEADPGRHSQPTWTKTASRLSSDDTHLGTSIDLALRVSAPRARPVYEQDHSEHGIDVSMSTRE